MAVYGNISGNSNIAGYNIGEDYISVMFNNGSVYNYTYESAGQENVDQMKLLAQTGSGLGSFIHNNAKDLYE